ncbi:MAG: phosphoenolpyruvate--protein phosphotransferase [Elusimicrobia bacterium]|nr:phosphoenolpyruvate--protein phosphotransferase [Elusimicrobiota bacterium]
MNRIKETKTQDEQLKMSKKHQIDIGLIEILVGYRKGTQSETALLEKLEKELGDRFYIEVIYFLTHTLLKSGKQAKQIFIEIKKHHKDLNRKLNRNIGIQVAILDYSMNVNKTLKAPTIIEEAKITEMAHNAITDKMTQAFDKKFLFHDLGKEIEKTRRYGTKFSILMADLDNLKKINDKYGHIAGDEALKLLCGTIMRNIRKSDTLYRFGGDEFIILIPVSTRKDAENTAQKILASIRKASLKKYNLNISASIGAASFNKSNIKNISGVIDIADKALYNAKITGKDKLSLHQKAPSLKVESDAQTAQVALATLYKGRSQSRFEIKGSVISSGTAIGRAFIYEDILSKKIAYRELTKEEVVEELKRIKSAVKQVEKDIIKMRDRVTDVLDKKYGDIFDAHRLLLNDPQILIELETELINERINAEHIVKNVFKRIENRFKVSENEILRERADDIIDLERRLLSSLSGIGKNVLSRVPPNSIIVASSLLPSDTINIKQNNVNAIITEQGSKTSHAGLLAISLNIPYIAGIDCPKEMIKPRREMVLDGDTGKIIVNPSLDEIRKYKTVIANNRIDRSMLYEKVRNIKLRNNNRNINILANVNSRADIIKAVKFGSDGIGLYRIEQVYMKRTLPPTEKELFSELNDSFKGISKEITVRLLDIGGDKILPYITDINEFDSLFGLRGIRVLLKNPRILETQLKAFLRLSRNYNISVLIPMVTIPEEIIKVRKSVNRIRKQLRRKGFRCKVKLGSMIETPSAVIRIKEILNVSDFVSIGTNDLIQYTMASGRDNVSVSEYYDAGSMIVMDSIKKVLNEANKVKKECILCGELASDPEYIKPLLRIGLRNFSVAAALIPQVKSKISEIINVWS